MASAGAAPEKAVASSPAAAAAPPPRREAILTARGGLRRPPAPKRARTRGAADAEPAGRTYIIALSGMHKAEKTRFTTVINRKIKESRRDQNCGARPSIRLAAEGDAADATHVVFHCPLRGIKFFLGCCRGSWLLSSSWLSAAPPRRAAAAGAIFADEAAHEIKGNESGAPPPRWRGRRRGAPCAPR